MCMYLEGQSISKSSISGRKAMLYAQDLCIVINIIKVIRACKLFSIGWLPERSLKTRAIAPRTCCYAWTEVCAKSIFKYIFRLP